MASLRQLRNGDGEPSRNGFDDLQTWIQMAGASFPVHTTGLVGEASLPGNSFEEYANIRSSNGIVAACMAVRERVFSEVTFRFASLNNGKLGRLFGTPELSILEKPWPSGTTGDLATRMIQDVDLAGNFYAVKVGGRIYRRDPSKMSVILDGNPLEDEFVTTLGYAYRPNGEHGKTFTYLAEDVCHWMPSPDPLNPFKGMSWLTPVLREVRSDNAASDYKGKFFANSATPNMIVKFPPDVMNQEQFDRFKAKMEADYAGAKGAGKTLYLAPGADVEVVGKSFSELDFSNTTGRDETRIASAAGVPAVIVGLKESLAGSSLNQGNYSAARRSFADGTMRPLYRSASGALESIVPAPQGRGASKLWYDDSQVAFFREDRADAANIQFTRAQAMRQLVDAGWTPDSVNAAFEAEDMSLLVHSGLYSVQLQPAGAAQPPVKGNDE